MFDAVVRGEAIPRRVECQSPRLESIPYGLNRSTFGVVEITRGCGRGCQFCSVALRGGKSIPLDHILGNVRRQVAQGADSITLTTEDLFLYEQGRKFATNAPALQRLLQSVTDVPGVRYIMLTHGTMAPVVVQPALVDQLHLAVDRSVHQHPESTHPDHRYAMMFVGLETGSVRLFKQFMKGKSYPYRPEQWPDVVLKGMEIMNRANWFPMCTFIIGLPGETDADMRESLEFAVLAQEREMVRHPHPVRAARGYPSGIPGCRQDRSYDGPAVGVLLHVLAIQPRLFPPREGHPVEI